jgi:hypothetical protein
VGCGYRSVCLIYECLAGGEDVEGVMRVVDDTGSTESGWIRESTDAVKRGRSAQIAKDHSG